MLHYQFDNDVQAQLFGFFQQRDDVGQIAEAFVHLQMVSDVVARVVEGRLIERHQPYGRAAEAANVVEALGDAAQIAAAVSITVTKQGRIDLIDRRVAVPEWTHAQFSVGRSTTACPGLRVPL